MLFTGKISHLYCVSTILRNHAILHVWLYIPIIYTYRMSLHHLRVTFLPQRMGLHTQGSSSVAQGSPGSAIMHCCAKPTTEPYKQVFWGVFLFVFFFCFFLTCHIFLIITNYISVTVYSQCEFFLAFYPFPLKASSRLE